MAVIVPGAEWRPDPVSSRFISLLWVILHTIVGTVSGSLSGRHYHIYVRADGSFVQIQDLLLRSAASVEANPWSIAIVAEDKGPAFPAWSGNNVPAYTTAQVNTIVRILVWIYRRFGLPPEAVRDTCLGGAKGTCWHRLGIDGNWPRWPSIFRGRENKACLGTSLSTGKGCPGDNRIRQINNVIIPRVIAILRALPEPEDDLTPEQAADLAWIKDRIGHTHNYAKYARQKVDELEVKVDALATQLGTTPEAVWQTLVNTDYGDARTTLRDTRTIARRTEQAVEALGGDAPPS